jgi:uncharacterized protein (TIGR03435 family)
VLTVAFKRNRASVRYWIWFSASLKFLVPFALLTTVGGQLHLAPVVHPTVSPQVSSTVVLMSEPFGLAVSMVPDLQSATTRAAWTEWGLLGFWLGGVCAITLSRVRLWRRLRTVVRSATPWSIPPGVDVPSPVEAVQTPSVIEPCVVGWRRPILVVPMNIEDELTSLQLEAVIAHEMCHVRRRDNLTAGIHMVVEALVWFHPLVWRIGASMVREREKACDEVVLRGFAEPSAYAEGILKICKRYVGIPLTCVSGVGGADLKQRVVAILNRRTGDAIGLGRGALLAAAAVVSVAIPVAVGVLQEPTLRAQVTSVPELPSFEVSSVKPNKSGHDVGSFGSRGSQSYLYVVNYTLFDIVRNAYGVQANQIVGGPDWIKSGSDRFDITAKAPEGTKPDQILPMTQALLAERFKLRLHKETRDVAMFALVMSRPDRSLGPQMAPAGFDCGSLRRAMARGEKPVFPARVGERPACGAQTRPGRLLIGGYAPSDIARQMSVWVGGRPVVDRTGLNGTYDLALTWTPDPTPGRDGGPAPASDPNELSLFTAVQEQLGLKLEPTTGPVEVLVIDSAERPMPD